MKYPCSKIRKIINSEFTKPEFTVQVLADHLGISTSYLRDLAWRTCGMCPYDMIENKRLEMALSLLHDENLNLHQVCFQSGYASPQTLRDAFKKRFGETPVEIRTRLHGRNRTAKLQAYVNSLSNAGSKTI